MPRLRLFGPARDAAGTGSVLAPGATVGEVLVWATAIFGPAFDEVLGTSRVWVNGEAAELDWLVVESDEVAVLPPSSGG